MCGKTVTDKQCVFGMLEAPKLLASDQFGSLGTERVDSLAPACGGAKQMPANESCGMEPVKPVIGTIDAADTGNKLILLAVENLALGQLRKHRQIAGRCDYTNGVVNPSPINPSH
jgi:hypothetical protein